MRDEDAPGYKHFTLCPLVIRDSGLNYAGGGFETVYGRIESRWRLRDGMLEYTCSVPPNTSATLILPGQEPMELGSGNYQYHVNF